MTDEVTNSAAVRDKSDVEAYNDLVAKAEIGDIRLVDVKYSVKPEYFIALHRERREEIHLNRSFEGVLSDVRYDEKTKTLGGQFDWTTKVISGRKKLLYCEAKYFVIYEGVPSYDMEVAEKYLLRVGRFATYPYFRSLVSHMSWESQADLPIMPVLK